MENRLSVEADTGYTYTLVPDEQDQCQAVLKVTSESTSAEPALVEITSEEPVAYSRVLYDDGNLIVVGNLLEYPEEYLQMTRTVYEEVGIEGKEVTSDLRNSFTEMTQVTVYSVSVENPADLSLSRDYYQGRLVPGRRSHRERNPVYCHQQEHLRGERRHRIPHRSDPGGRDQSRAQLSGCEPDLCG